jgi:Flp pilus assembly protein TadG
MHRLIGEVGRRIRGLGQDRAGAIAPLFALSMVAIILAVGIGLDVGRQVSSKNNLQDAVDATGFALAHLPTNTPPPQLQTAAETWINANLRDRNISGLNVVVTPGTGQITITVTGQVKTTLMALGGFTKMDVQARSTVNWAPARLEVALVLDNTGSMNKNNKIQTLIDASQQLVTTLFEQANGDPNAVKISVVPFSMTVNVGPQYQNAAWMSGVLPPEYATALQAAYPGITWPYGKDIFTGANVNRFTLFNQIGEPWKGCVESRPAPYDVQETPPTAANPATLFVPFFAPDEPDYYSGWYDGYSRPQYPNQYLTDDNSGSWSVRLQNAGKYDTTSWTRGPQTYPWGNLTNYQAGPNAGCALIPLLRLTSNETAVHKEISQMVAIGDTNLAMGMVWGWHTISPLGPFGDAVAYNTPNTKKVIIFLTDGWNQSATTYSVDSNNSYYSGLGYAWQNRIGFGSSATLAQREAALDSRTSLVCDNIKKANPQNPITVYTVRIDVANTQSPAVLQSCASDINKFFDVPNPSDLADAFATIAGSISQLRLAS